MKTLTKCIYGFETDPKKTPFGLLNNQVRVDNIIQSAGWFNAEGERLGQGDLSLKEMQHIAKNIPPDEAFFILTESDSIWDMPSSLDRMCPGFQYILDKAAWAIIPSIKGGVIIRIRDDIKDKEDAERDGIKFVRISRDALRKAFLSPPKPVVKKHTEDKDGEKKDKPIDTSSKSKTTMLKAIKTYYKTMPSPGVPVPGTPKPAATTAVPIKTVGTIKKAATMPTAPQSPPIALPGLLPKKKAKTKTTSP